MIKLHSAVLLLKFCSLMPILMFYGTRDPYDNYQRFHPNCSKQ
ncbi:hypothetical protein AF42_02812 [Citrobacter freundii MGH 56]|nr:hypothetical protein AF42_02812 [Citrobacter freundii MGH 56]